MSREQMQSWFDSKHPLWQSLSPSLCYLDSEAGTLPASSLAGFDDSAGTGITLVRPDRFVLAHITPGEDAAATLDTLQQMLAA